MAPAGKRQRKGQKRNADAPEFSEGRPAAIGKVFAALALERPWASLRSQGETGCDVLAEAVRGIAAMGLLRVLLRACASGAHAVEVVCASWLLTDSLDDGVLVRMPCDVRWQCP